MSGRMKSSAMPPLLEVPAPEVLEPAAMSSRDRNEFQKNRVSARFHSGSALCATSLRISAMRCVLSVRS